MKLDLLKFVPATVDTVHNHDMSYLLLDKNGKIDWWIEDMLPKLVVLRYMDGRIIMTYSFFGQGKAGGCEDLGLIEDVIHRIMLPSEELLHAHEYWMSWYGPTELKNVHFFRYMEQPNWNIVTRNVLKIVEKHQRYLTKKANRDQLAYIMMRWINLYYCVRVCYGYGGSLNPDNIDSFGYCENNPKYEIENLGSTETRDAIIYDAFCEGAEASKHLDKSRIYDGFASNTRMNEDDFDSMQIPDMSDRFNVLLYLHNKTMDDWYELLGNTRYEYNCIYKTKQEIDDHLLFVNGGGYSWNSKGYISHNYVNKDGEGHGLFFCAKERLRPDIRQELFEIIDSAEVQSVQNAAKGVQYKQWCKYIKNKFESKVYLNDALKYDITLQPDPTPEDMQLYCVEFDRITDLRMGDARAWSDAYDRPDGIYYPISEYSNIHNMPANAHTSYVRAAIRCVKNIIDNADKNRLEVTRMYKQNKKKLDFEVKNIDHNLTLALKINKKLAERIATRNGLAL